MLVLLEYVNYARSHERKKMEIALEPFRNGDIGLNAASRA